MGFQLPDGASGTYGFQIGARPQGGYEVLEEWCKITSGADPSRLDSFDVDILRLNQLEPEAAPLESESELNFTSPGTK